MGLPFVTPQFGATPSIGAPGRLAVGLMALLSLVALDPGAGVQGVYTLTFTGGSTSDTNAITVGSPTGAFPTQTVSWTPSASTAAGNAAALLAALRANNILSGVASFASPTSSTVTITVLRADSPLTIAESLDPSGHFSVATTTAPAASSTFPFGGFCIAGAPSSTYGLNRSAASAVSAVAGPVTVITLTHAASTTYRIGIDITNPYAAPGPLSALLTTTWVSGANLAAAVANGVTALTTLLAGYPVTITSSSGAGTITLSWPVGWGETVAASSIDTGSGTIATADTAGSALPALAWVANGGDYQPEVDGQGDTTTAEVQPFSAFRVSNPAPSDFQFVVPMPSTAPTSGSPVYVSSSTGLPVPSAAGSVIAVPFVWGPPDPLGQYATIRKVA